MKQEVLELLEKQGFISEERLALIFSRLENKENLDFILASFQVPVEKIADAKSVVYNLPRYVGKDPAREVLSKLSADSSSHYKMLFLGETEDSVLIGILDPEIAGLKDAATFLSNASSKKPYQFFILSSAQFEDLLSVAAGKKVQKVFSSEISDSIQKGSVDVNSDESPVVLLVRDMVSEAIKKGASDIHIEPGSNTMRARYRIDGELLSVRELPMTSHLAILARIKILCNLKLDEKRRPQDGHFSIDYENRKIDFRVSTMPSYFGEKVVIRVLDTYKGVRNLADLDMQDDHLQMVKEALNLPYGIVLITGPTGSGKTSTLYSMLTALDHEARNIVSLEDPVEYSLEGVNQSQVVPDIGYTFASGLRSILRQDPDVIMVGEIRDKETAELAVQAALTGHLVFSTIHTNTAISTITRLVEIGIEPYLLAPTVRLVIGQRLVKKLVPESVAPHQLITIDGSYRQMVKQQFGDLSPEILSKLPFSSNFHAALPSKENYSGTSGRVAVFEMLKVDKEIENLILNKADENAIYNAARKKGMITMKEDALLKSMQGVIPFSESMSL
jgi:type IV pilus assembly protein PilB